MVSMVTSLSTRLLESHQEKNFASQQLDLRFKANPRIQYCNSLSFSETNLSFLIPNRVKIIIHILVLKGKVVLRK